MSAVLIFSRWGVTALLVVVQSLIYITQKDTQVALSEW